MSTHGQVGLFGGAGNDTIVAADVIDAGVFNPESAGFASFIYGSAGDDVLFDAAHTATGFGFHRFGLQTDVIERFRAEGPNADGIILEDYGFSTSTDTASFLKQHVVGDGHGGSNILDDQGRVIVDVLNVLPTSLSPASFTFIDF